MPRRIVAGQTFMITRRTEDRRFLFRPDSVMNQIFLYLVGLFATRFGMVMHLNRIMALATASYRKTLRTVWDKRKPSVVELLTPEAMLQKMAYTIGNPVAAGLVRTVREWPGTILRADQHGGQVLEIARPQVFFARWWPASVQIRVGWPPALLESAPAEELKSRLAAEVERVERAARAEVDASGRGFMGAKRILACSPFRRTATSEERGGRAPSFAVGRDRRTEYLAAVHAVRAFRAAYREARERWRAGDRGGAFPHGTWWMARFHGARVEPQDTPAAAA